MQQKTLLKYLYINIYIIGLTVSDPQLFPAKSIFVCTYCFWEGLVTLLYTALLHNFLVLSYHYFKIFYCISFQNPTN